MQLIAMLPDAFIGGCGRWMIKLITSGDTNTTPAGVCRHCNAIINLNNFICPACSCSYPFIDVSNMEQREEVTRSVRMLWQEIPNNDGTVVGFGHPHKVPPTNRMLQIKSFVRMNKRLTQPKFFITFNGGKHWQSYAEMYQFDPNWNGTMTRGGWTIHNIHLSESRWRCRNILV